MSTGQDTKSKKFELELKENRLYLHHILDIFVVKQLEEYFRNLFRNYTASELIIDLNHLIDIDSAGVATLNLINDNLKTREINMKIEGASQDIQRKLDIFSTKSETTPPKKHNPTFLEQIGNKVYDFFGVSLKEFTLLNIDICYWSVVGIFNNKESRKGEFYNQAVLLGVNAVPIVSVLAFIIGLVLALQSASQLRNFGANIYIVDLTVIAMMREMGPLITAILVAGRSGSSIAAEIGTMKVTSELDALKTMALNPIRFVVVPKMHGAIFTVPFLSILASVMGILGGALVAYIYLDIAVEVFFNRIGESLFIRDIVTGFIKSVFFAAIIVMTGSFYGFQVEKGAEGVGKVTTLAVVVSISLVIVADSIFSLIFY